MQRLIIHAKRGRKQGRQIKDPKSPLCENDERDQANKDMRDIPIGRKLAFPNREEGNKERKYLS